MAWKFWQKAPKPIEVPVGGEWDGSFVLAEPVMPARELGEAPAPEMHYCVITRVKVEGVVYEHHGYCGEGVRRLPKAGVTVTTGHWV